MYSPIKPLTAHNNVQALQHVADNIEIAAGEDEEDVNGKGDGRSTGVLPLRFVSDYL